MNQVQFEEKCREVVKSCSKVIVGKEQEIKLILISFLCSGHVLLEDLPGTGKTTLLKVFAKTIGQECKRIQFTPDLLPSDITGIRFYNQKTGEFIFQKGPLFSNLILADEINRATPRTQSSLLEAMEEHQISADGETYRLEEPFFVMATQNPVESYGTFPLPEAQMDRFFMRLSLGYMKREQEMAVICGKESMQKLTDIEPVLTKDEIVQMKEYIKQVTVHPDVLSYLMDIIEKTRADGKFAAGVSTRGAIALYRASQAFAAVQGREFVIPEDVKELAPYVLSHRILAKGVTDSADVVRFVKKLVFEVPVPLEKSV
ncbi:MAG: MoxR family ATPase [bacterium]|nr:MoxR family ATPase [bacterium]